jgi:hypothetical protein
LRLFAKKKKKMCNKGLLKNSGASDFEFGGTSISEATLSKASVESWYSWLDTYDSKLAALRSDTALLATLPQASTVNATIGFRYAELRRVDQSQGDSPKTVQHCTGKGVNLEPPHVQTVLTAETGNPAAFLLGQRLLLPKFPTSYARDFFKEACNPKLIMSDKSLLNLFNI